MRKLHENIVIIHLSSLKILKRRIGVRRLILVAGFWFLVAAATFGQCTYSVNITFTEGQDINTQNIGICGAIGGGGQNDIDIYSISPSQSNPTYQWQWSTNPGFVPYTTDPSTGTQFIVSSFSSTPGTYYFRLKVSTSGCPAGVYSDVVTLTVTGTPPAPPSSTGASLCGPGSMTLNASGCTGGTLRWYSAQFGGTLLQTGSSYTTPVISTTTTYWVSCTTSGGCESQRAAVVASITSTLPATPGVITGPTTVCANSINTYSIAAVTDATTYTWSIPGWTINSGQGTISISTTAGPSNGTISVTAGNGCGTNPTPRTLSVTVNSSSTITGTTPGPRCGTGTVTLGATASNGGTITWYSAATGGTNFGTGNSYTTTSLSSTTTYYVDATLGSCTSSPRTAVVATISTTPTTSNAGTNQTVCGSATLAANTPAIGTGAWSVSSGPSLLLSQFSNMASPTATFTPAGGAGNYVLTWTISNPPCTASSSNITITINTAPVVAPIVGPSGVCIGSTITLTDATPGGTWSSGNTGRATVANGVVTPVSAGTVTIYYSVTLGSCTTIVSQIITVGSALTPPNISFDIGSDMWSRTIAMCSPIGGGGDATDIDIRSSPGGVTRQWEYSIFGSSGPWTIDPYTGSNWVVLSFGSVPGTYYFRLKVTSGGCSVYSNTIVLTVNSGIPPTSPTVTPSTQSSCSPGSFTFTASNCSGTLNWYSAQFAGTLLTPGAGSHPSYTTPTISSTTTYYVSCTTGSGNNACESPRTPVTVTIGAPANLGTIIGPANVCGGLSNVTYSVTSYSGMTYSWSYSGAGATITPPANTSSVTISFSPSATSGNLHVTGTSSCGTSTANDLAITINTFPAPTLGTLTQPTCTVATGSVVLNNLPASGTWTLTRTPGGTTTGTGTSTTISGLAAGSYTYSVANASGCTSGPSINVVINTQPSTPTAPVVGTITQPDCTSPTGSVALSGLPASGTWTLTRTPGGITTTGTGATFTITGIPPGGPYSFTVTNADGCTSPLSANVVINNAPTSAPVVGNITQPTCTAGSTGSVILSGLPAGNWVLRRLNDNSTTNGNGTPYTVTGLTPGIYTFDVHPVPGTCWSLPSANIVINTPTPPSAPEASTTVQPTCTIATGTIVVTAPTGPYDYNIDGGAFQLATTFLNVGAGNHSIRARSTADNTCISNPTVVTVNAPPQTPSAPIIGAITDATCTVPTGSVALSGLPASGTWTLTRTPGSIINTGTGATATISGIPSGITYTFTVTNADGCTSAQSAGFLIAPGGTYPDPPGIQYPITQPACAGGTGSVTLIGLPSPGNYVVQSSTGTNYNGNTATKPITGLAPGTYTFTVHKTASGSCWSLPSESVVIVGPPDINIVSVTAPAVLCFGGTTTVTVVASGGTGTLQYSMDGTTFQSSNTFTGRTAGSYTLTVRDANSCTKTAPITISQPASALTASITTQTNILCNGGSTGQATVTATGGTPPYSYSWAPLGGTVASVTGIPAGTFIVTVTDFNGCTTTATATLTEPPAIIASASAPAILCNSGTTTITVIASGGTGTLNYSLDGLNFQPGNTFPGQTRGDYTITVRDANLCTTTTFLTIAPPPEAISASASAPVITCSGGSTTVTVTASGGVAPLEYSLNGVTFQPGNTFAGLGTGTYTITVRDDNQCTTTTSVTVTSLPPIVVSASAPPILCSGGTTTITVIASGGTGTLSYSLDGITFQSGNTFATQPAGTYSITVRDVNLCTTTIIFTVDPGAALPVTSPIYHQ